MRVAKRRTLAAVPGLLVAAIMPQSSAAQLGIEGAIGNINDVNFFFSCWTARDEVRRLDNCLGGKNGYGLEVMYQLRPVPLPKRFGTTKVQTKPGRWVDSTRTTTRVGASNVETALMEVYRKPDSAYTRTLLIEFALGYSQFSGFGSANPDFELRGAVRELPAAAMYTTLQIDDHWLFKYIQPYLGLRTGLIQLQNVQAFDTAATNTLVVYSASANAFQFGWARGAAVRVGTTPFTLFYERSNHWRRFPGVQWSVAGSPNIPAYLPRTLDFTGAATTVGLQLTIR